MLFHSLYLRGILRLCAVCGVLVLIAECCSAHQSLLTSRYADCQVFENECVVDYAAPMRRNDEPMMQ